MSKAIPWDLVQSAEQLMNTRQKERYGRKQPQPEAKQEIVDKQFLRLSTLQPEALLRSRTSRYYLGSELQRKCPTH